MEGPLLPRLSSELSARLLATRARRALPGDLFSISRRRYHCYSYQSGTGWTANAAVPFIELEGGKLFVSGAQVVTHRITRDHVSWHQHSRTPEGDHFTSGHLFLASDGLTAHGRVSLGNSPSDVHHHDILASAIAPVTYTTRISKSKWPASTPPSKVPATDWQPGLSLQISFQQSVGASAPSPVVLLDGQDVSELSSWRVDDTHTILSISLSSSDCAVAPDLYAQATVSFDAYAINAPGIGSVSQRCSDVAASTDGTYLWVAEPDVVKSALALTAPVTRRMITRSQVLATAPALEVSDLMTILPDDVVSDDANSMLLRNMKWAMGQNDQQRKWLSDFFGERPPVIVEPDQQALVRQSLDWYQNKFALAYLTQSFNSYKGPNEPDHRLSSDQSTRLTEFLKSGLAKDKDFNVQQQGIFVDAFIGTKPRLGDYLADHKAEAVGWAQGTVVFSRNNAEQEVDIPVGTSVATASGILYVTQEATKLAAGALQSAAVPVAAAENGMANVVSAHTLVVLPQTVAGIDSVTNAAATTLAADSGGLKWAKVLFTTLTTGPQFTLMVNRIAGAAGDPKALGPLNNFASLLTALERTGTIARNYFESVLTGVLTKLVPNVVHQDKDTIMQWLPTAMQELFRKLANGELPQETDISKQEGEVMYQEFLKHQAEISLATADLLQSITASGLIKQAGGAEAAFGNTIAKNWPKLAKASRFMLALGWIGAVSSVIVTLVRGDWKHMTTVEKAEFVTNIVQLTVVGFDAVPLIWQGVKYITLKSWTLLQEAWNSVKVRLRLVEEQQEIALNDRPLITQQSENIQEVIDTSTGGETLGRASGWARLFEEGVLAGTLKIIGAVTAAAMAGYSLWQLINDVQNHGSVSTIVFDSLIFAANLLSAVCLIADLFIATSFLPIAGAVLAIAGIILGILAGFLEKPDNPVDDWMKDHGIPFAAGLPAVAT